MSDPRQLTDEYLAEAFLLQLATVQREKPWVCTLHFASDERLNFYFISRPTRRHSKEILENPNIAGTIVKPHTLTEKPRGLQFEGIGGEALGEDLEHGQAAYKARFGYDEVDEHLMYVLKPSKLVLFDAVNFPDDPQQDIQFQ